MMQELFNIDQYSDDQRHYNIYARQEIQVLKKFKCA